jgi:beta-glucuronidase
MLRPKDTPTRERRCLDGLWRFAVDAEDTGRSEGWHRGPLPGRAEAPVPSSYNDLFADAAVKNHVGDVWYQTVVRIPARWAGERVVLRFDAATHRAVVWVGDTEVVRHEGGYTPFEADVTDAVELGAENRITIVVDSTLNWQSIPPGNVVETPDGRRQRYFHDFFNYGGLHRSVWLSTRPTSHISDVTVATGLDGSRGTVGYRADVEGAGDLEVRVSLLDDDDGTAVAEGTGRTGELVVDDVHPWTPTRCRSGSGPSGSRGRSSSSTTSPSTSRASASTRTPR